MTKIPSVVEAIRQRHIHLKANNPVGFVHLFADIEKALAAEREAGAREFVSELRKVLMGDDGEDSYIALSARIALFIRKHEALTPPTK